MIITKSACFYYTARQPADEGGERGLPASSHRQRPLCVGDVLQDFEQMIPNHLDSRDVQTLVGTVYTA